MNWGTSPLSILPDIKDRLLAPVNYRYSAKTIRDLVEEAGLVASSIIEDHTGVYVAAEHSSN